MSKLDYIRVVLIQPSHPGNIGATARAMGNMGISDLVLVNPAEFPSPIANARAAGADLILENARVVDHLDEAIADCELVIGTTARSRSNEELERCQFLIRIPVDEAFSSLNLGSAATVILYEIRKQFLEVDNAESAVSGKSDRLATAEELRHFYEHLQQFIEKVEFSDGRSTKLQRKMARLFNRSEMNAQE